MNFLGQSLLFRPDLIILRIEWRFYKLLLSIFSAFIFIYTQNRLLPKRRSAEEHVRSRPAYKFYPSAHLKRKLLRVLVFYDEWAPQIYNSEDRYLACRTSVRPHAPNPT